MQVMLQIIAKGKPGLAFTDRARHAMDRIRMAVLQSANELYGAAQQLVPADTGDLKRSAKVTLVNTNQSVSAWVTYGVPYAVFVHENLRISHPVHKDGRDCGGQAKYLEAPARRLRDRIRKRIGKAVNS